jgi:hypothetical protein
MMIQLRLLLAFGVTSAFAAAPPVPTFRAVNIDTNVGIGYGVTVADVDGDQRPDILLVDKNTVAWYRNPSWEKFIMTEKLTPLDHVCIAAADIDGDGKAEVAVGGQWNPGDTVNSGAVFYLVPPADRTRRWQSVELPHEPVVHRMRWVKTAHGFDLVVLPLHGRANKNGQGVGVKILAYRMPADPRQPWTTEQIDDTLHLTHNFNPVQWDADPEQELLVAGKEGVFLFDRGPTRWARMTLVDNEPGDTAFTGAGEVRDGHLPGGKRFLATIEPMHGHQVVIYTPPEYGSGKRFWTRNVIDDSLVDGHAVACGDLTKAGYDQVVVGWRAMNKPGARVGIRLYTPLDSEGKNWARSVIDDNTMACEDLCLADLNGDGRLDIVAAGRATHNLIVYFNQGADSPQTK